MNKDKKGENMEPEVSAKEFGALEADVRHIKEGVDKHTITLERISHEQTLLKLS
mgnify:CR=1 FL=1